MKFDQSKEPDSDAIPISKIMLAPFVGLVSLLNGHLPVPVEL